MPQAGQVESEVPDKQRHPSLLACGLHVWVDILIPYKASLLRKRYILLHNWIDAYDCNGQILLEMEEDCSGSQHTQWTVLLGGEEDKEEKRKKKDRTITWNVRYTTCWDFYRHSPVTSPQ